jgi:hypothetical protein
MPQQNEPPVAVRLRPAGGLSRSNQKYSFTPNLNTIGSKTEVTWPKLLKPGSVLTLSNSVWFQASARAISRLSGCVAVLIEHALQFGRDVSRVAMLDVAPLQHVNELPIAENGNGR